MALYVGLDIGTSGVRAVAFTERGQSVAEGNSPLQSQYLDGDSAEQNPLNWWKASSLALLQLSHQLGEKKHIVKGIGITAQCPTFTLLYEDGSLWETAYLYQDNRAVVECDLLMDRYGKEAIYGRTGGNPSPFFILPKLQWLHRTSPHAFSRRATVVQPRDYVAWKLSDVLVTDPTHAACTLAYDIHQAAWIREWTEDFSIHNIDWPTLMPSLAIQGGLTSTASEETGFPAGIPIIVGAGDSLSAVYGLFDLKANEHGAVFDMAGTSTCLHAIIPEPFGKKGVNVYPYVDGHRWCAEVGLNTTGAVLAWNVKLLEESHEGLLDKASQVSPGAEGLIFLPHLSGGERDSPLRTGAWIGLHLGHDRKHLIRSALEGVALAMRQKVEWLRESGCEASYILSSGGGARASLWNQIKADVLQMPITCIRTPDMTVGGAAKMAAAATGGQMEFAEADIQQFTPNLQHSGRYNEVYERFQQLEDKFQ